MVKHYEYTLMTEDVYCYNFIGDVVKDFVKESGIKNGIVTVMNNLLLLSRNDDIVKHERQTTFICLTIAKVLDAIKEFAGTSHTNTLNDTSDDFLQRPLTNYLADITNCDEGTVGYPDKLFIAGYAGGDVSSGYIFSCTGGTGPAVLSGRVLPILSRKVVSE